MDEAIGKAGEDKPGNEAIGKAGEESLLTSNNRMKVKS